MIYGPFRTFCGTAFLTPLPMAYLFTHRLLPLLLLFFCWARPQVQGQSPPKRKVTEQLDRLVADNAAFANAHTGFVLYDIATQQQLYAHNADRNFVPASNVKLLTFYVANRLLGHRTPAVFYQEFPDHYELWGTGYPLTLHPAFGAFDELYPWLSRRTKPIVLNFPPGEAAVPRYGAGWSWDDYHDAYVYEQSAFPLYGNRLFLDLSPADSMGRQTLVGVPPSVAGALRRQEQQQAIIHRSEYGNNFTVSPEFPAYRRFPLERPLHLSPGFLTNELAVALPQIPVTAGTAPYPEPGQRTALEANLPDTLYRRLLRESDNYLAEQLLLQAAADRYGIPDKGTLIGYVRDTLLPQLGVENIRWVDGSGLSRYNLLSPRHLARVVMALDQEVGRNRLLSLLPAGGESGTLKRRFTGAGAPYVWAKTGSLSGVVCLSGMVRTSKGKWLAFSFLHNNYVGSSRPYYREMERVLEWCWREL